MPGILPRGAIGGRFELAHPEPVADFRRLFDTQKM